MPHDSMDTDPAAARSAALTATADAIAALLVERGLDTCTRLTVLTCALGREIAAHATGPAHLEDGLETACRSLTTAALAEYAMRPDVDASALFATEPEGHA